LLFNYERNVERMSAFGTDTFLLFGMFLVLVAGPLSFLSACVLPIFPAYLSYITGVSLKEIQGDQTKLVRDKLLTHSAFVLFGVSLVFISLGVGASFLGKWINDLLTASSGNLIQQLAGIFIIVMGLFVGGWLNIKALMSEKRVQVKKTNVSYLGTFLVGLGFAAGWTPCIGPIFGSILLLAASD